MTTRDPRLWRFISHPVFAVTLLILLFSNTKAQAQSETTASANGLTLQFVKSQTSGSVNEVASNVLRVINNSGRRYVFNLEIAYPQNWKSLTSSERVFNVANGDSLFVPVRVIPDKNAQGNVNYFMNATAITTNGVPLASAPWSIEVVKISRWSAALMQSEAFFKTDGKEADFKLQVRNSGNSPEDVNIIFNPDSRISVLDSAGKPFAENTLFMNLPVGLDTVLTFTARLDREAKKEDFFAAGPINQQQLEQSEFKLNLQIKSLTGSGPSWGGRIDFKRLRKSLKFKSEYGTSTLPLKVEFNTYNVLSQFTNFSLDLSGEADLGRDRALRYYYQTIISTNSIAGTQFLGSYRFGEYSTPKFSVAAGDIGSNLELLVNGVGARGTYHLGNKVSVSGIYATRPQPGNVSNNLVSIGGTATFRTGKGLILRSDIVNQDDQFNAVKRNLTTLRGSYRFKNQSLLDVKLGYSIENHQSATENFSKPGYGILAKYTGRIKGVSIASQARYNSGSYSSQFRGTTMMNTNMRYSLGKEKFVGLRLNINERAPEIYSRGILFPIRKFKRNSLEARFGWATEGGNFVFFPRILDEEVLDVRVRTTGAGISFATNSSSKVRVFSRFYSGLVKPKDYDIKPYMVSRWENTIRYKNLNVSARYYFGPFNVLDNLRVIEDNINPQSFFLSAFARLNFTKARISVRPTVNMSYESILARWRMNMAPQITYYSKSGFEFNTTVEFFKVNQGESPLASIREGNGSTAFSPFSQGNTFLRFGIVKQFNISKPGKKSHDLEIVVFKDVNGNNVRDRGEELEKNVIVRVNGESLMTDEEGAVTFKDLPQKEYAVSTQLLANHEGWFKSSDLSVNLIRSKTLYIPLKRGSQIAGSIILQKAQFSALGESGMDLSGIRVTATDNTGNSYSGLTGQSGEFRLYVPFGQYTVSVNESAVDSQFELAQKSYTLNINNIGANYQLAFYLIEKRRKLNIKRFDNK